MPRERYCDKGKGVQVPVASSGGTRMSPGAIAVPSILGMDRMMSRRVDGGDAEMPCMVLYRVPPRRSWAPITRSTLCAPARPRRRSKAGPGISMDCSVSNWYKAFAPSWPQTAASGASSSHNG